MSTQYGHYLENGIDFRITERNIPRNWYNYLWNDNYITYVSQTSAGESFLQNAMGSRIKLVKDRGLFIKEGDESFGIGGLPVGEKLDAYHTTHKRGTTDIYTEKNGISATVGFIVPRELNCELWKLGITSKTKHNEAAPAQHELAPVYVKTNLAVDNNLLIGIVVLVGITILLLLTQPRSLLKNSITSLFSHSDYWAKNATAGDSFKHYFLFLISIIGTSLYASKVFMPHYFTWEKIGFIYLGICSFFFVKIILTRLYLNLFFGRSSQLYTLHYINLSILLGIASYVSFVFLH